MLIALKENASVRLVFMETGKRVQVSKNCFLKLISICHIKSRSADSFEGFENARTQKTQFANYNEL